MTYNVKYVEEENKECINGIVNPWLRSKRSFWIQNLSHTLPKTWTKKAVTHIYIRENQMQVPKQKMTN